MSLILREINELTTEDGQFYHLADPLRYILLSESALFVSLREFAALEPFGLMWLRSAHQKKRWSQKTCPTMKYFVNCHLSSAEVYHPICAWSVQLTSISASGSFPANLN
jgi:hypothetical protein